MAKVRVKWNNKGWDEITQQVIDNDAVPRLQRVADAANEHLDRDGYKVSVEGRNPLQKRNFRATVITATADAMYDNQKNNRLVSEFHRAGGE
ncbi:hypothetical protein QEH38_gp10 [Mycobacterium phage LilSpotty]|uniref:Uncharacterized protein n=1 Tax=Mycobacterium phage LilSpotty TaxID=2588512 RepID=A0A4Y6EMN7_9CAUD|nr:hypothetical protein QEH38_gp10 [Mycobacterium phage LilSpotty]QDF19742.1 hypothetical protein SEA_LILSPOTTY_10 [Mycobacterium phage LilSpotty]